MCVTHFPPCQLTNFKASSSELPRGWSSVAHSGDQHDDTLHGLPSFPGFTAHSVVVLPGSPSSSAPCVHILSQGLVLPFLPSPPSWEFDFASHLLGAQGALLGLTPQAPGRGRLPVSL